MPSYFHQHKGSIAGRVLFVGRAVAIAAVLTHAFPQLASAQIIPDGSLGANPSVVIPESPIRDLIDGGVTNDTNLFHSFQDFNIETGQEVYFTNPVGIETILTRVTGNNSSEILGTLGVLGEADYFFINPNGIVFGPAAQLDVGGSFLATTAAGIQFKDQGLFSASDPQVPAILTVTPSALFFSETAPGSIINRSVAPAGTDNLGRQTFGLRVPDGESLLLAGGELLIDGGWLNALGGHIDLIGISGPGQVDIITDGIGPDDSSPAQATEAPRSLNASTNLASNDVILQNRAVLFVMSDDRGSITVSGKNIDISSGSLLLAGISPSLGTSNSQGGDITLRATDDLTIAGPGRVISNIVDGRATGNGGDVIIEASNFNAQNAAFIVVNSFGNGNAGKVSVQVQDTVTLTESSTFFNEIFFPNNSEAGGITIQAGSLNLLEGSQLASNIFNDSVGQAEGIQINVRDAFIVDGIGTDGATSGLFARTQLGAEGFAGNIFVTAGSLEMTRGGIIQTGTSGEGNAGNVTIEVDGEFFIDGANSSGTSTGIFTDVDTGGTGEGGDIQVTAGTLTLNNGAGFISNTFSFGDAGDITVDVQGDVSIDGAAEGLVTGSIPGILVSAPSGLFSNVGQVISEDTTVPAFGNGGAITLTANSLSLTDGGTLATAVVDDSVGNAAPIMITVQEDIIVDGVNPLVGSSGLFTEVRSGAMGNASNIEVSAASLRVSQGGLLNASIANDGIAGEIVIDTDRLEVLEGGQIIVTTFDSGNAGNILVKDSNSITLTGENSGLFANTTAASTGNSGSIFVDSNTVTIQDGAKIALDSQGSGEGGDIQLNTDFLSLNNNALISAETVSNQGGIITLVVDDVVLLRNGSNLSATAGLAEAEGDGGNVNITTDFLVAVPGEDSNITANAFFGQGGNVQITATGIYGIEFQTDEIPIRNDITASSAFGIAGEVDINTLVLDPTRGTSELPSDTSTPRVSQRCNPSQGISNFVTTGRGGIPLGPEDAIAPPDLWEELYTPNSQNIASEEHPVLTTPTAAGVFTEAQGWDVNAEGNIVFVTDTTQESPHHTAIVQTCSLEG